MLHSDTNDHRLAVGTAIAFVLAALAGSCGGASPLSADAGPSPDTGDAGAGLSLDAGSGDTGPALWFAPGDPTLPWSTVPEPEYMTLFTTPDTWPSGAARVKVLPITVRFVFVAPPSDLRTLGAWLRAHGIKLALAYGSALSTSQPDGGGCGVGEGYSTAAVAPAIIGRLRDAGLAPDFLSTDEPLWYGHYSSTATDCQYPIETVVQQSLDVFRQFQAAFPAIRFDSYEPVQGIRSASATWQEDLTQWVHGFSDGGLPLAYLSDDIDWRRPLDYQAPLRAMLDDAGVGYGVFITGGATFNVGSDATWMAAAQGHLQMLNAWVRPPPAQVILASWQPYPTTLTPEGSPLALTHLVGYVDNPAAQQPPPIPLVHLHNASTGHHLLTADAGEVAALETQGFLRVGFEGSVYGTASGATGLVPLRRLFNPITKDRFFTTSASIEGVMATKGYVFEAEAGYAFVQDGLGGIPLYEVSKGGQHYYTVNALEWATLPDAGWAHDGIAAYLLPGFR